MSPIQLSGVSMLESVNTCRHFLGVNVFGLGETISDETFYTRSQIMVEKVPEFLAESLCLRQGM